MNEPVIALDDAHSENTHTHKKTVNLINKLAAIQQFVTSLSLSSSFVDCN